MWHYMSKGLLCMIYYAYNQLTQQDVINSVKFKLVNYL